ncbi:MAG TPA: response regulator transcription factor [Verrucomicrobiae bacterium]|nr:response regulator transcription factor [Verrucomicrobiae bacterium]
MKEQRKASSTKPASSRPRKIRIFIVDDHPMMRQGLSQLIGNEPDLELCGEAEDAGTAVEQIDQLNPDLAIIDISLRSGNGIELIKDLQGRRPELPVLVLSMHDESLYAERVLRAGGRGYVMKQEGGKKIMQAIRQVLAGQTCVSPAISSQILDSVAGRRKPAASPVETLTDREFEVFQLIGQGRATKQIAQQLRVSVKTAEVHRVNIKKKLKIGSIPELIRFAVRWGEAKTPQ